MNKAKAILKDLRNLDLYIASLIRRREKSKPPYYLVQSGQRIKFRAERKEAG